jgi:aminocarboxymuconate-semialdehyde decarboxylase
MGSAGKIRQTPKPIHHYLKQLYYDTVTPSQALWPAALETVGAEQIVFGTDYPFARGYEPMIASVERQGISESAKEAIFHETAERLLGE